MAVAWLRGRRGRVWEGSPPPNQTRRERSELLQPKGALSAFVAAEQQKRRLAVVVFIVFKSLLILQELCLEKVDIFQKAA